MTANKSLRKLTMKQVRKAASKFDDVEKITFEEIDEKTGEIQVFYVNVHPLFAPPKIDALIQRLANNLTEYHKIGIEINDELIPSLILYECVKSFTDLRTPKNIKEDFAFFYQFIKTHYFKEITEVFIQEEVNK